jgi:hypothetical protein
MGLHGCPAGRLPDSRPGDGDPHVIRNAGGVITADEIGSLAIRQRLPGTEEISTDPPDRHARGRDVKARGKIKNYEGAESRNLYSPSQ